MTENTLRPPRTVVVNKQPGLASRLFGHESFRYWAVVPLLVVLIALTIFPIFELFRMSVSEINFEDGQISRDYVGLEYFNTLQRDIIAPIAIRNTLTYVVAVVIIETILGFLLAFAVSKTKLFAVLYRSVIIIPLLIPPVAIGTMWGLMYDFNYGIITQTLYAIGVDNPPLWTADPDLALISIIIVDVWHWTSFMFLIMLAGVEAIPPEPQEAARVDGASEWQILRHIILPLMAPTIVTAMMLRTIFAFKVFDQIFVLTSGGPGTATQVISMHIYNVFSTQGRVGYASFLSLMVALIMSVFIGFYLWANNAIRSRLL